MLPVDSAAAGPDDSIGSVVAIRGKVTAADPEGTVRKLKLKAPVYLKDTLRTEKRSRLQVMFIDNTIVSLGPSSEMIIAEYHWKPDKNEGGMKTKIKEGVFRIMGGAITKTAPENFITETPAATIGIRGSMYAGRVSNQALTVMFQGGKGIYVTNPAGTVDISTPGYGTHVEGPMTPPETPQRFSSEEIKDLNNALSAKEDPSDNNDATDTTEGRESTETDRVDDDEDSNDTPARDENEKPDESSDPPPDPDKDNEKDDGSILAANTSSNENGDGSSGDADTVIIAAPAESATQVITNDLDNAVNTDNPAGGDNFSATADAITDSVNTINDTLKNNSQEDLSAAAMAPLVSGTGPVETVTTEGETTETETTVTVVTDPVATTQAPTTTTTIIAAETTTTITTIQVTTTTTPPPPPVIANFTGKYLAVQYDNDTGTNTGDAIWSDDIAPVSTDGSVQGTAVAVEDSKNIPYLFQIATFDDSGTYTGETTGSVGHEVDLTGQLRTFNTVELHWSDLGEFVAFYLPTANFDSGNYKFQELGFAGIASATLPTDSVETYSGHVLAALTEASNIDADTSALSMEVNWHNGKVLGRIEGTGSNIIYIGDVTGNALSNVKFLGDGKMAGATPTTVDGTTNFGKFYGSQHQGFGMTASGNTYSVDDQVAVNTWSAVGAGFRVYENPLDDPVAPTGATLWEGFTTGLAEDMAAPGTDRRLYLSTSPSDLEFSVDKDAGTFSGTLSAADVVVGSAYIIDNMVVGGANGSAFVLQDNFGAGLGGGGAVITDGGNSGGLRTHGNYMVSMPPDSQFSEHVTWGYWEVAYLDPTTADKYHIHQPGSLWIAGERTPVGYVQGLIDGPSLMGTYQGPAQGIEISNAGVVSELTNGSTNLTIDFSQAAVADKISGTIGFDQANFTVAGVTATSGGFTASFTDANVNASAVNGAYFGPNAEAIGGNFHTDIATGEQYMGIFGGNKIP